MTTRQDKVNSLLQRLISEYFIHEKPDELTGLLTIKEVNVAPDMHDANVYFSVVGQDEQQTQKILESRKFILQKNLGRSLSMKFTPRLHFIHDSSGEYADHISKLLKQIK